MQNINQPDPGCKKYVLGSVWKVKEGRGGSTVFEHEPFDEDTSLRIDFDTSDQILVCIGTFSSGNLRAACWLISGQVVYETFPANVQGYQAACGNSHLYYDVIEQIA